MDEWRMFSRRERENIIFATKATGFSFCVGVKKMNFIMRSALRML
jgi:hypothetical protein